MTVTLRRFAPDLDLFVWEGSENRESMKNMSVTVQVFNDGDAEVQDVIAELPNRETWGVDTLGRGEGRSARAA